MVDPNLEHCLEGGFTGLVMFSHTPVPFEHHRTFRSGRGRLPWLHTWPWSCPSRLPFSELLKGDHQSGFLGQFPDLWVGEFPAVQQVVQPPVPFSRQQGSSFHLHKGKLLSVLGKRLSLSLEPSL